MSKRIISKPVSKIDSTNTVSVKVIPVPDLESSSHSQNQINQIGLKEAANYVTIAHITVLLFALTAAKSNMRDEIQFIKSFLPNFKPNFTSFVKPYKRFPTSNT